MGGTDHITAAIELCIFDNQWTSYGQRWASMAPERHSGMLERGAADMATIQLPDDQAAALEAKAAEQGLTLEDWLRRLSGLEDIRGPKPRYRLAELIAQCDPGAPLSDEDQQWLQAPPVGREAL